ncbi:NAD(P)/FAD-dependent oxidoreductase [Novosphingobium aquae]|uniref:FAD-dependent oxidoreductase n=1 Tax=Novosphingobium aquae TaxID=3133435 RepID=A0ABU8SCS0_9SPHN
MNIAIIGAGIAGLSCADALQDAGHCPVLFDKGRGPGGRMSTRRVQTPLGEAAFDHGAQYFTARDPGFKRLVDSWQRSGVAAPWPQSGTDAWVGVPGMNAVTRQMAAAHDVAWGHQVTAMVRRAGSWWLTGPAGETGPYDAAVLAIPAEQAAVLLSLHDFAMARKALMVRSQPCWTGMFVFDHPLAGVPPVMRNRGDIAWAARNSAKPGRSGPEAWVVQASATWSAAWLEAPADEVAGLLHRALAQAAGCIIPEPLVATAHRWRYALSVGTGDGALWNPDLGLGACGDWLMGPRVESAWLSGRKLAAMCKGAGPVIGSVQLTGITCPKGHVPILP